jgi:hypothetical protein
VRQQLLQVDSAEVAVGTRDVPVDLQKGVVVGGLGVGA